MKRVQITPQIETLVRDALGADADFANFHVYEAIALNDLPLRKRHPLYNGARVDRTLLLEMAAELSRESRPVHVGHIREDNMPLGRVFYGTVHESNRGSELRVLFFLDATEGKAITKVENGTVDQVSVSILPKQVLNSVSGFDYLGPDATFDNIMTGDDGDGNVLGEDGVYAKLVGLDAFFEMSLVGQGGAQNARIVRREQSVFGSSYQKLAASGVDPNALVLAATVKAEKPMDLTELVEKLTDAKAELSNLGSAKTALEASVAELTAERDELTTKLAEAGDAATALAEKDEEIAALTAVKDERDAAIVALTDVAKVVLTAAGKPTDDLPNTVADLSALIESTRAALAAALVAGGKAAPADADSKPAVAADFSAFSARK